ncbi:hypothetical protein DENSPDRAFT_617092 [Dentipellis sp. KUC8613]|nr:hypothetical protein DENSPDRAFT_617092 [Dentipellis sp. KUC8613]
MPSTGGGESEEEGRTSGKEAINTDLSVLLTKLSITQESYFRTSTSIKLYIDGHIRTTRFEPQNGHTTSWKISPGVVISSNSSIIIQPSQGRRFLSLFGHRKQTEAVDIPGKSIFDVLGSVEDDEYVFEQQCKGFCVSLTLSLRRNREVIQDGGEPHKGDKYLSGPSPSEDGESASKALPENVFVQMSRALIEFSAQFPPDSTARESALAAGSAMRGLSVVYDSHRSWSTFSNT